MKWCVITVKKRSPVIPPMCISLLVLPLYVTLAKFTLLSTWQTASPAVHIHEIDPIE